MIRKKLFLYWLLLCSQFCYGQVKDSMLFRKIRVQSSSSICLQGESLRIELAVANRTDDSIAITFRFTNRGNKIMGIERNYNLSYQEQRVSLWGNFYSYNSLLDDYYCGIKLIYPGEHIQFTIRNAAPQYKTIFLELIYFSDITFLVKKEVLYLSSNRRACYSLKKYPAYEYLETIILEFEKNSQEIDILLPIKGCLCEPTLTPIKD